ncbi:unnamed protein product [Arabis nemorensis]|uniref:Uncharacterized protein n=1 Tax=Arabis nemorensis TaxID=586526 RepID=A0A565AZ02_9BRAS|nr:unnamed protein product [Arabis nemorensis]
MELNILLYLTVSTEYVMSLPNMELNISTKSSVVNATPDSLVVHEIEAQVSTSSDKDEPSNIPTVHNQETLPSPDNTTLNEGESNVEGMENNRFALLELSDASERDLVQDVERSRGGRPLKATQKFQDMQWTIVGGRGNRGRGGRGGRGLSN